MSMTNAASHFYGHGSRPAGNSTPYLQWRAPLEEWQVIETEFFGPLVPDWFRTDAVWLDKCFVDSRISEHPEGSGEVDELANFMASQHWSVISIGTVSSGMFFHTDSIATSTYHLQVQGRKKWFVCPPPKHLNHVWNKMCSADLYCASSQPL